MMINRTRLFHVSTLAPLPRQSGIIRVCVAKHRCVCTAEQIRGTDQGDSFKDKERHQRNQSDTKKKEYMTLYRERASSNVKRGLGDNDNHRPKSQHMGDMMGREAWWRCTLKDSPNPGSYHIRNFIEEAELNPVRVTYGFANLGRKVPVHYGRQGKLLLPGAYEYMGSIQEALKRPASYVFKSCPRPQSHTLGVRDKDIDLSPCHYNVTEKPVPKLASKHPMFRSTVKRAPPAPRKGDAGHS